MRKFNSFLFAGASLLVLGAGSVAAFAAETSELSDAETVHNAFADEDFAP